MAKIVLDGTGIISGTWDSEEMARRREEERKKELVAEELEAAAAVRRAEQAATKDHIEAMMITYLGDEIAEELKDRKSRTRTSSRSRGDFLRFKDYCTELDLPHLPASPQAVAGFLAREFDKGRAHVRRCIKSISTTHHKADLPSPCDDLLVRALLRHATKQTDKPSN